MSHSDAVLIIGGGVIGVCSAYFLAERGREVILLDKGEICSGASYGNAGMICPSHSIPFASPRVLGQGLRWLLDAESPFYIKPHLDRSLLSWLWRFRAACREERVRHALPVLRALLCESQRLYEALAATGELQFGYTPSGMLELYRSGFRLEAAARETEFLAGYGIPARVLDRAGVVERVPQARPDVIGGIFYPEDAHILPAHFVTELARRAQEAGVCLSLHTEVFGFETGKGRITKVRTTRGDFRPGDVVLAGGSWSAELARELGIDLPIQPAKGYSITVRRPENCPTLPLHCKEVRVFLTPMGETLRLAGTLELAGLDLSINKRRVAALSKGARAYLAGLEELEVIEIWRGLRPCTPDGLPILERSPLYENLILAAGHAMIGMSLGPITGKLVAQIACRETPALDIAPLSARRW
jgi:D-amino-acid dehydrogenase